MEWFRPSPKFENFRNNNLNIFKSIFKNSLKMNFVRNFVKFGDFGHVRIFLTNEIQNPGWDALGGRSSHCRRASSPTEQWRRCSSSGGGRRRRREGKESTGVSRKPSPSQRSYWKATMSGWAGRMCSGERSVTGMLLSMTRKPVGSPTARSTMSCRIRIWSSLLSATGN